jgi:uncharacterized membrane protein YjjP (DUF1212 family)
MHVDAAGPTPREATTDVVGTHTAAHPPALSDVAHTLLRLGRLMLVSGAATEHVQEAVTTLAQRFGCQPRFLIFSEGMLLTLQDEHGFVTKLGPTISGTRVNMKAVSELDGIVRKGLVETPDTAQIEGQLDAIEHGGNRYPRWLVALGLGLTAASLARLFGGELPVVAVAALVGILSAELGERLEAYSTSPIARTATVAFVTGMVGALVLKGFPNTSPVPCLVAAGTILVPGIPLINGMRDALGQHVGVGISHLALGITTVLSIVVGLLLAASVTGAMLSVGTELPRLPIFEEVLFSAFAGLGLAVAFNVRLRAVWACMICAVVGHGLRSALMHMDVSLAIGSLAGACAAALLARVFAQHLKVSAVAFTFPGVVTLLPAPEVFRAALGGLEIIHAGAAASPSLVGVTIALALTAILVIASIAIGLSLGFAAPFPTGRLYAYEAKSSSGDASIADTGQVAKFVGIGGDTKRPPGA